MKTRRTRTKELPEMPRTPDGSLPRLRCLLALTAAALLASACAEPGPGGGEAVTWDSAGVMIVENRGPLWADGEAWRVPPEPEVQIGAVDGEAPYLLSEVQGAARLSDGRIVVLDGGARELRFFDTDGGFLHAAGGPGEGPGEFDRPGGLRRVPGDTLLVQNHARSEVLRFDSEGRHLDRRVLDRAPVAEVLPEGWHSEATHFLPDGGFITPALEIPPPPDARPTPYRRPGGQILVSADGEATLIDGFPGGEMGTMLQRRSTLWAAGGDPPRVAIGDNARYEISIYTAEGVLERRIRNARQNDPLDEAFIDATRALMAESGESAERLERWGEAVRSSHLHETLAAFELLFLDRASHLWVRRPALPDPQGRAAWDVYDPEGLYLGVVELPTPLFIEDVGEDFVLGRYFGELVEQVRLYRLQGR